MTRKEIPDVPPPSRHDYIAPAPRVSVQAFCETPGTTTAVESAGLDRRLGKAHLTIKKGGMPAAIEAYRTVPAPNVIVSRPTAAPIFWPASTSSRPCAMPGRALS